MLGFQQRIAFREVVKDGAHVPPPDARILALHAACARIAHLSGAAEVLDELYRDAEPVTLTVSSKEMAVNPRGGEELMRALHKSQLQSPYPRSLTIDKAEEEWAGSDDQDFGYAFGKEGVLVDEESISEAGGAHLVHKTRRLALVFICVLAFALLSY